MTTRVLSIWPSIAPPMSASIEKPMRRFLNPHHLAHRVLANISNDSSRHDASWQFARSTKSEQRHGAPQFGGFNDHERAKTRVVEMISDWVSWTSAKKWFSMPQFCIASIQNYCSPMRPILSFTLSLPSFPQAFTPPNGRTNSGLYLLRTLQ